MKDKVCLVTGATSGIGLETALELARMGATVVVGGRDMEKASNAVIKIRSESNNPNVDFLLADLSDFVEVKRFADEFKDQNKRLDVLVNNAGAIFNEFDVNPQDIEMTTALNLFSPYLLTGLLFDVLQKSAPSRIVNVSSMMHKMAKNEFENLNREVDYKALNAYAKSKLALMHFNYMLAEKLEGTNVTTNVMHPGWVKSNFGTGFYTGFYGFIDTVFKPVQVTSKKGAETIIFLASSSDVEKTNGKYFIKKKVVPSSRASYLLSARKAVWAMCEEQTGFRYEIKAAEKETQVVKERKTEEKVKGKSDDKPGGV